MRVFKTDSIKMRITMWYALFIVLITAFLVGMLFISQDLSSQDYYEDQLIAALDEASAGIRTMEDAMGIERYTDRGAHITILDAQGELLLGKRSFSVPVKEETMRIRRANSGNFWYLMDKPVHLTDGKLIWLRAYISSEVSERYNQTVMLFGMIAIPLLLLAAVFGGFALTRRAFRPLDSIIRTAENISETTDLRQRFRHDGQEDEVGKLADTFDGMLRRLEKSIEGEKTFISDASHELRTPISVIRAQSEYALGPDRTVAEKDEALRTILDRSTKAGQMISQMLMLSRMDSDRLPVSFERIDISELAERIAQEMEDRAGARGIAIERDIEKRILIRCDELLMIRMMTNLMENAVQYGRENGFIRLGVRKSGGRVEISVADNGIGIAPCDQQKIWQRFYQVEKSGDRSGGFGLGLSFVKWIVSAHDGTIAVSSNPGEGSCFTVSLPVEGNDKKAGK